MGGSCLGCAEISWGRQDTHIRFADGLQLGCEEIPWGRQDIHIKYA